VWSSTLNLAKNLEESINIREPDIEELSCCNWYMHIFCEFFGNGNNDVAFRDKYTRDLTFRKIWLDFLADLLRYIKYLDRLEPINTPGYDAFLRQTQTTIDEARKQLIKSKPSALDNVHTDADTLYNMRDILNEM